MKNNKLLILLVGLASISIISYVGDYIYYKVPSFNDTIINSEVESENTLNIYLYDSKKKEYNNEDNEYNFPTHRGTDGGQITPEKCPPGDRKPTRWLVNIN